MVNDTIYLVVTATIATYRQVLVKVTASTESFQPIPSDAGPEATVENHVSSALLKVAVSQKVEIYCLMN